MVSRVLTILKVAGWKTSMVSRVSIIPIVPRVSMMSEGMRDEMVGRYRVPPPRVILRAQLLIPHERHPRVPKVICS